ncbi:MAG: serine hydrolase [Anaerolineaceae bacterium]
MRTTRWRKKKTLGNNWVLFAVGMSFLALSLFMVLQDRKTFLTQTRVLPSGSLIGEIPVGGLEVQAALERVLEAYSIPVELRYQGARMQFLPEQLGCSLDLGGITQQLTESSKGTGWWAHMWGRVATEEPINLPINLSVENSVAEEVMQTEIPPRYDRQATSAHPIVGDTAFAVGQTGTTLDLGSSLPLVSAALTSPDQRVVDLKVEITQAGGADWADLQVMLKQQLIRENFRGLAEVYLADPATGKLIHFAQRNLSDVPVDVAYSGASTVKIPVMVSVMRRTEEPTPNLALGWMNATITQSLNPPADALMKTYLDNNRGPLIVTEDMQELGYQNTFLAGYFEPGSPLLRKFDTPANSRRDVYLDPDFYNQTVPSEAGDLLMRIYQCSLDPAQPLFDGQVTQTECETMLGFLRNNRIGALIESGLPPSAVAAHKHGWVVALDGYLHTMSDAGVIYTPGGDFVLVIFIHTEEQLVFETGERIFARLSQSIYNFYNLNDQMAWLVD